MLKREKYRMISKLGGHISTSMKRRSLRKKKKPITWPIFTKILIFECFRFYEKWKIQRSNIIHKILKTWPNTFIISQINLNYWRYLVQFLDMVLKSLKCIHSVSIFRYYIIWKLQTDELTFWQRKGPRGHKAEIGLWF